MNDQLQLFHAHQRHALRIARRMRPRVHWSVTTEELEQAALLGLWAAAQRFEPGRCRFAAFLKKKVWGAVLDYIRIALSTRCRKSSFRRARSLTTVPEWMEPWFLEREPALPEIPWQVLSQRQQQVLTLYDLEGKTLAETGRQIGLSETRTGQIRHEALVLLREGILERFT